jgi:hypothetical protein
MHFTFILFKGIREKNNLTFENLSKVQVNCVNVLGLGKGLMVVLRIVF